MNGRVENLWVVLTCLVVIIVALIQMSCQDITTWEDVEPPLGEYKLYLTIKVQEDLCEMPDGRKVNGSIKYNTIVRSVADICVSLQSDDPQRTMNHELDHAWRNAVGLDAKEMNQ